MQIRSSARVVRSNMRMRRSLLTGLIPAGLAAFGVVALAKPAPAIADRISFDAGTPSFQLLGRPSGRATPANATPAVLPGSPGPGRPPRSGPRAGRPPP